MKQLIQFLSLIFLFIIASCASDDTTPVVEDGFDYVPLTQGSWYEYRLDSIIYDDFDNSVSELSYDLRVEVGNTFVSEGRDVTRLLRYIKERESSEEYELQSVWFASIVNNRLETTEENLDFIKFVFPPLVGSTWQGNQHISGEGNDNPTTSTVFYENPIWNYEILTMDETMTIQSNTFDEVAHVSQINQPGGSGAVQHIVSDEWYAKGVGLVKKRMEIVVENCGQPGCSDKNLPVLDRQNNRKGYILDLELTDYQIQ